MIANANSINATLSRKSEIEALGLLKSETQVIDGLREIAGTFGKVVSICALQIDPSKYMFLVEFERSEDARVASSVLGCYLYGLLTLVVSVLKNGKGVE